MAYSWDTREEQKAIQAVQDAHAAEINCVDFSPSNEWVLATGSSDKTAGLFDLRYLKTKIHSLETNGEVVQLAWSPHEEAILATASNFNRRVHVWDLARIGDESDGSGPPELLVRYIHCFFISSSGIDGFVF
jgi:histone-binding protein RBBP4